MERAYIQGIAQDERNANLAKLPATAHSRTNPELSHQRASAKEWLRRGNMLYEDTAPTYAAEVHVKR